MLYTPDSHLSQQIDELKGHRFGLYRPICDPTLRSGHNRVLMVTAITISSLWTVKVKPLSNLAFLFIGLGLAWHGLLNDNTHILLTFCYVCI